MTTPLIFGHGYTPTLIGRVVTLHAAYYAKAVGFGAAFESKVARELAAFVARLDHPSNEIWWATHNGEIVASIAIDGQPSPDAPAVLHWFIVDPNQHGQGLGQTLLDGAMSFCDKQQFPAVELSTFAGLDAARTLYERAGFVLTKEQQGASWGQSVTEQTFMRRHPNGVRGS